MAQNYNKEPERIHIVSAPPDRDYEEESDSLTAVTYVNEGRHEASHRVCVSGKGFFKITDHCGEKAVTQRSECKQVPSTKLVHTTPPNKNLGPLYLKSRAAEWQEQANKLQYDIPELLSFACQELHDGELHTLTAYPNQSSAHYK